MVETCLIGLREAARIINVVRERGISSAGAASVLTWSDATASRGVSQPMPDAGLAMILSLGLAVKQTNGRVTFNNAVTRPGSPANSRIEWLPADLAGLVLERVMSVSKLRTELEVIFAHCHARADGGFVDWDQVPAKAREAPAWLWLQRIGVASRSATGLTFSRAVLPYLAEISKPAVPLSQADLDVRLALQRERAGLAEILIMRLECERLRRAGADDLAEGVVQVSIDDVCAGFDIRSFEVSGDIRVIEVKSSFASRDQFFLSDNEQEAARRFGDQYWLAWVGWSVQLPNGPCDVAWFHDLHRILNLSVSPWMASATGTVVRRIGDDTAIASPP